MANIIRDRDKGYKALLKRITSPSQVTVGIHEEQGAAAYPGGQTVAEVAERHELGLGPPARSFLGAWADENEGDNRQRMRRIGQAVVQGKVPSIAAGLERFGLHAVGGIKRRIREGIAPPLDPRTVAQRKQGSDTPLIDTGILWSSITAQVDGKKDSKTAAREAKQEAKRARQGKQKQRKLLVREGRKAVAAKKRAFRKVLRTTSRQANRAAKTLVRKTSRSATRVAKRIVKKVKRAL